MRIYCNNLQQQKWKRCSVNMKLNEECKELHLELQQMKKTLNETKFMEWTHGEIVNWIVDLDGEYQVYDEQVLSDNVKKEQVDESLLPELEGNDLHPFGIIALKHKIVIMNQIKRICVGQQQQLAPVRKCSRCYCLYIANNHSEPCTCLLFCVQG
eukprot:35282_1